ncbi:MAG: 1-acyl-sn-glycerol-3-phosphate acyltransferase, partial [Lachnospiraceae bacterium]|nr:1-acyl-sn-glycerol-3-phosphate acyltransferase [Lachnospiraceae bacterium]
MIRLIIAALFILVFFICSIFIWFGMWIYGLLTKKNSDLLSLRIVQWAFRVIMLISGVRLEIYGEENVPKDRAVLYIGNHSGIFDVVTSYSRVPSLTGYISKKEWSRIPF